MEITCKERNNIVYVTFNNSNNKVNIEKSFDCFHKLWINYYENKKEFYFVFDTTLLKAQNIFLFIEYSYKLINIIDYFKKYEIQYLKSSILIIDNDIINNLFYSIFFIKKPLAEIFIIKSMDECNKLLENIFSKNNIDGYIKSNNITYII